MTNLPSLPSDSGTGSPSVPSLLSNEEIALLLPEEAEQYLQALEEYERQLDMEEIAAGLVSDLPTFMRQAWNIVEPETPLVWSWHYEYLCEWLTMISSGEFKQRYPEKLGLIINVPPRSGKSTFASVLWPVWTWLKYPARRFLFASHTGGLSESHNQKRAWLINSKFFQERFGNRFKVLAESGDLIRNDHTGQFHVTSIGSGSTGYGGLILVGDDLLDREKAFSETYKNKTNSWIDSSFSKMLDDQVRGVFVHISQRLAVDDPTGHLLGEDGSTGNANQWVRIKIRREAEEEEIYEYPLSGQKHVRSKGDILQAERCPPLVVARLKLKSREWANQEQQEPTPSTGAIINPNWLKYYRASDGLPSLFQVIVSIDCTFKSGDGTDMVAIHKYALSGKRRILLDRRTERLNYPSTKQAAKEMARGGHQVSWLKEPMPAATQLLIENKANGPALTDELRDDPEFTLGIIEYDPGRSSKTERFVTASSDAEAGLCYFPTDAPWIGSLRGVLCQYAGEGSVPFDDDCDAFAQLINWSRQMQYGLLGYLEKQEQLERGEVHRYMTSDPDTGEDLILEWDPVRKLWYDPRNPERTWAAGDPESATESDAASVDAAAAEGSEAAGKAGV